MELATKYAPLRSKVCLLLLWRLLAAKPACLHEVGGRNVDSALILIDNNKPSYSSKFLASKSLNISTKTISKYLGALVLSMRSPDKSYKGLYFYTTFKG